MTTLTANLSNSVTGHVGTLGRGGVVIAMSSGLVATMGLPASAVAVVKGNQAAAALAIDEVVQAAPASFAQTVLEGSPAVGVTGELTAPKSAPLTVDETEFTARPVKKKVVKRAIEQRSVERTSRTTSSTDSSSSGRTELTTSSDGSARGSSVLAIAARYVGTPYVYGGNTPAGFDCSGFVQYVFAQLGYNLPRTSAAQYGAVRHVSRSEARAGDIVFFINGGQVTHDGIYAGDNMMYDSPRTGETVQKREVYSSNVVFGRVIG